MKRRGKKNEIPQRYFLPFCPRKLPSLGGSSFDSNFSHLPTLRQVSWEKASHGQTMALTGASVRGWSGARSESGLQMVLNVGDWGAVPSVPCPLPGPVKPNGIRHKSGFQRGLWRGSVHIGLCGRYPAGLPVPCLGTRKCLSLLRSQAPDGTTKGFKINQGGLEQKT